MAGHDGSRHQLRGPSRGKPRGRHNDPSVTVLQPIYALSGPLEPTSVRHGTICSFAAMRCLTRNLICRTEQKHAHVVWLRFLKQIHREGLKDLDLHLIAGKHSIRARAKVEA